MPVHSIHLGNVWEPPTDAGARWLRRFGRPAGLVAGDRVLLVCERPAIAATLILNGTPLVGVDRGDGTLACDVTDLLADRNELVVLLPSAQAIPAATGGGRLSLPEACGRFALEIVSPD
jgi:hypothetical protein